jgi:O-antigen/teichoic acid export membrane protein
VSFSHYSAARAKKSLFYFLSGKLLTAGLGLGVLLLTVRSMQIGDYGIFITLIALLEILYLLSGFGLSFIVQRYVPEFRLRLTHQAFRKTLFFLLLRRMGYSIPALIILWFAATPLFDWLDIKNAQPFLFIYLALVAVGCQIRFFDELFPALFLQGYAQVILLIRNLIKLLGIAYAYIFMPGLSLEDALLLETSAVLLALMVAMILFWTYTSNNDGESGEDASFSITSNAKQGALRYFCAQIMGQVYSPNAVKLMISSAIGPTGVAIYGFAQSLTDMLGNYQPATLLAGWIRPVVVSRYVQYRDGNASVEMLGALFKTGFVVLAPAIALLFVFGDTIGLWLSKGKFDHAGLLLTGLTAVVMLQGLHQLLSIAIVAFDQTKIVIRATLLCCLFSIFLSQLIPSYGLLGAVYWLIGVEMTWIAFVATSLRTSGRWSSAIQVYPYAKLASVAFVTLFAAMGVRVFLLPSLTFSIVCCGALLLVAIVAGFLSRVYVLSELQLFKKILPARFLRVFGPI